MLTLFACPKAFTDSHIATIQRNAITSWTLLRPRPQILLFGDEPGVAELSAELGIQHIPGVERNEQGTPLLNDIFSKCAAASTNTILCYLNSDMLLTPTFSEGVAQVKEWRGHFLLSGGRQGLDLEDLIDFSQADWHLRVSATARERGTFSFIANDYFVFSRGLYRTVPPLAIGRGWFDAWLFSEAKAVGADIIDASEIILAIHQNHQYHHLPEGDPNRQWVGPEAEANYRFTKGKRQWFLFNANYRLTPSGVRRVWGRKLRRQGRELLIDRTARVRKVIGLDRATLRKIRSLLWMPPV